MNSTDNRGYIEDVRKDVAIRMRDPDRLISLADEKYLIAKELYKLADSVFKEGRELQAEAIGIMCEMFEEIRRNHE